MANDVPSARWVAAGGALREGERRNLQLGPRGRNVVAVKRNGVVHCLDRFCYHAGGDLGAGEIEDLGEGLVCVVCPDHNYKVELSSGQRATRVRNAVKLPPHLVGVVELAGGGGGGSGWACDGVLRQRVHHAREDDDGVLWVFLEENPLDPALTAESSDDAQQIALSSAQYDHVGVQEHGGAHRRHFTGCDGEQPLLAAVESDRYAYAQAHT